MSTQRLPLLPRVGFQVLTVVFSLLLAIFVLLFIVVSQERWSFLLPAFGMLAGLSWVRGARRTWLEQHAATSGHVVSLLLPRCSTPGGR